jgi:hypothetical protein
MTDDDIDAIVDRVGDWFIVTKSVKPKAFCHPLFSSYITAMSRIKLHSFVMVHDPYYVDTDSIVCDHMIHDSSELGMLKVEKTAKEAIFVRPKMYMFDKEVRLKGCPKKVLSDNEIKFLDDKIFKDICIGIGIDFEHFIKFKESIRKSIKQNKIVRRHKDFFLEDNHRVWPDLFNLNGVQDSKPLQVIDGIFEDDLKIMEEKALKAYKKQKVKEEKQLYESDLVDNRSISLDKWKQETKDINIS